MKTKNLFFLLIILTLLIGACNEFQIKEFQTTEVSLNTGLDLSTKSSKAITDVSSFSLTVTAAGMSTIERNFTEQEFNLDIEAGPARTFTLEALDTNGNTLFSGSSTVDLTAGETVSVVITMSASGFYVNFVTNGGTAVATRFAPANSVILAPTAPTRSGYEFIGWYSDAMLLTAWNFNSNTITSDITLYAGWLDTTGSPIFVTATGNDTMGDGSSINPFATIQKGITEADSIGSTEVRVAAGTYATSTAITLVDGISVKGGYNSINWSRDIETNITTINSTPTDSTDRVFYATSLTSLDTTVDGFTINATMNTDGSYVFDVASSNLTISNNIVNNSNSNWHSYHVRANNSTIYVQNNQFNCIDFGDNYSGGIYLYSGGTAVITNNIIETEYSGAESGGIYTDFYGTYDLTIRNNIIDAGYTSYTSGAIGTKSTANFSASTADITLRVDNNIITTDYTGSTDFYVLFFTSPTVTIESFRNNAIYTPGAISFAGLYRNAEGSDDGGTDDTTYIDITSFETAFNEASGNMTFTADDLFADPANKDFAFGAGADTTITEGGIDGTGQVPAWSYSTDITGITRTGDNTTGWSMGPYEQD